MDIDTVPEDKAVQRAREKIERKHGKTPEELYLEREKRVTEAVLLGEPDRVPVGMVGGYFPLKYIGEPKSALFYKPSVLKRAVIKTLVDFEPDITNNYSLSSANYTCGRALEALGTKYLRWPGGGLLPDYGHQWLDAEYMKEDEYDLFMTDPTDFMMRYYLPRIFEALEPLSQLPAPGRRLAFEVSGFLFSVPVLASPEFRELARAVLGAGREMQKFNRWKLDIGTLGFPEEYSAGGVAYPAFDVLAKLRGTSGIMIDLMRQPEKLVTACERVWEWQIARAVRPDSSIKGQNKRVGAGAIHSTSDRFMSRKQFEKFCWPTYKKSLLTTIEMGFIPSIFCEGKTDDRLEYFLELPKGRFILRFEEVDMARAKSILGNHCCISGNVPASILQVGSPQEVEDYCRNLINVCGKNGGFILSSGSSLDDAKPENVKAMIDSVKKYGWY